MEFYSLVNRDDEQYADIIEFENGELAVYWDTPVFTKLFFCESLQEFKDKYVFGGRKLIKEGVQEDYSNVKDILYSA